MTHPSTDDAAIDEVIAAVTAEQWDRLHALATELLADSAAAGQWAGGERDDDGVITMPWFRASETTSELLALLYEAELVTLVFDWTAWWPRCRYRQGHHISEASPADLVRFITAVVRGDRFSEGALDEFISNGSLPTAIVRLAAPRVSSSTGGGQNG